MSSPDATLQNTSKKTQHIVKNMCVHFITAKSGFRYCVTPSPDPNNLQNYKDLLLHNGVKTLVKLCDETRYDTDYLIHHGINVINIPLQDGTVPSKEVVKQWTNIIKQEKNCIAVHCVSGLGRAPLFTCIGLIIIEKMDPVDAILFVRKTIRSALNANQINFLETFKYSDNSKGSCIIC